jgi:integrase/recombinase XerD
MIPAELAQVSSRQAGPLPDRLRLAVAAYLARFKGSSREHTESDLRCYLAWCAGHSLDPLAAQRAHLEPYIRWMQEIRRFKPSTIPGGSPSRPGSTGLALPTRSWSIRLPSMSAVPQWLPNHPLWASPTCSSRPCLPPPASQPTPATSRWWPCSGCWACGSSMQPAQTSPTSGKSTATGCCEHAEKGPRSSWSRCRQRWAGQSTRAVGSRTVGPILLNSRGARMDRHAATRRLRQLAGSACIQVARAHPHMLRHTFVTTMLDAGVDLRDVQIAARHADPRTTMRYDRACQNLDRQPELHPRRLHGLRHLTQPASPAARSAGGTLHCR